MAPRPVQTRPQCSGPEHPCQVRAATVPAGCLYNLSGIIVLESGQLRVADSRARHPLLPQLRVLRACLPQRRAFTKQIVISDGVIVGQHPGQLCVKSPLSCQSFGHLKGLANGVLVKVVDPGNERRSYGSRVPAIAVSLHAEFLKIHPRIVGPRGTIAQCLAHPVLGYFRVSWGQRPPVFASCRFKRTGKPDEPYLIFKM